MGNYLKFLLLLWLTANLQPYATSFSVSSSSAEDEYVLYGGSEVVVEGFPTKDEDSDSATEGTITSTTLETIYTTTDNKVLSNDEIATISEASSSYSAVELVTPPKSPTILTMPAGGIAYKTYETLVPNERRVWLIKPGGAKSFEINVYRLGGLYNGKEVGLHITTFQHGHPIPQQYSITEPTSYTYTDVQMLMVTFYTAAAAAATTVDTGFILEYSSSTSGNVSNVYGTVVEVSNANSGFNLMHYPSSTAGRNNYGNMELTPILLRPSNYIYDPTKRTSFAYVPDGLSGPDCGDSLKVFAFNINTEPPSPFKWQWLDTICGHSKAAQYTGLDLVLILFESDTSGVSRGFHIVSSGSDSSLSSMQADSVENSVEQFSSCGGTLTAPTGGIVYKPFESLVANERCVWFVSPPSANSFTVQVHKFGFPTGQNDTGIHVMGFLRKSKVEQFLLTTKTSYTFSSAQLLMVTFFTGKSVINGSSSGFILEYRSTAGGSAVDTINVVEFTNVMNGFNLIRYPNSGGQYGNNELSPILFKPVNSIYNPSTITNYAYVLDGFEGDSNSCFDAVTLWTFSGNSTSSANTWTNVTRMCGDRKQAFYTGRDLVLFLFESDSSTVAAGFHLFVNTHSNCN